MLRRIRSQVADRVVHLLGTGGAVQADGGDVEHLQRGQRRADLGAQQHGARRFQRHLHLHGNVLAGLLQRVEDADQPGFRLQNVLAGLQQQNVNAALDQRDGLLGIGGGHVVEADVSQRRQLGRRPHRSRDKALASVEKARGNLACQLRGGEVDLVYLVLQVVFSQHDAGGAEGVGLHHVAAHASKYAA